MKQLLKILSFLLLLFLLTAENCSDGGDGSDKSSPEIRMTNMFQLIEDEFVNDELNPEILSAFEKRAIQKLNDLADYLNIYTDNSLSKEFRLHAKQLILESFNSEIDMQTYFKSIELSEDTLNDILYFSEKVVAFNSEINTVSIKKSLQKKSSSSYIGEIGFTQKNKGSYSDKKMDTKSFSLSAKMHVSKIEKDFGKESQDVWEIYFGEIK